MEKRIGAMIILVENQESVPKLNQILSGYSDIIIGRQGLPLHDKGVRIISLIIEGSTDQLGALSGKIGRLSGLQVKSVLTRSKENPDDNPDKT
jgi:putative iron-only hydrogenase system regulator